MSAAAPPPPASRPPFLAYAGAWAALAAVYAALYTTNGIEISRSARAAVAAVLPAALLGLASLDLARRFPWPLERGWRLGLRLAPALVGLTVGSTAGWLVLIVAEARIFTGAARWPATGIILWQTVINGFIHVALAGVGYAWHTAEALRQAREQAAKADALRARAELQLLRSQVQPHFILNVLHALLGLVRRDPGSAEHALERLGELLRFGSEVHQGGADWVPLLREWEFVKSYLELEGLRLGDRLRVSLEADPAALLVAVPPFALQPVVENAIVHGVAPRASGGRIAVSARRAGGRLRLSVADDGPGSTEAAVLASPRMGLRLLRERLAALYGGRAFVRLETPPGGGFTVLLDLPDDPAADGA
jgi:two-component system LytT family sensor kinase